MSFKVFIDGKEGTTGLKIFERFSERSDVEVLFLPEEKRKDIKERKRLINDSDYTFLCLPDEVAKEAVCLCENTKTTIIDTSTAHRINPEWVYGFPELSLEHRERIKTGKRIAVPGCYASGFVSIVYPLIKRGILPKNYPVCCHAVSGYSGAGKKGIAQYETVDKDVQLCSPRLYALTQEHKHLPEMEKISGLDYKPIFNPYICDYFSGMSVSIPIHVRLLDKTGVGFSAFSDTDFWEDVGESLTSIYKEHYKGCKFIKVSDFLGADILPDAFICANNLVGTNNMQIIVHGNNERITITSRFDNLGKGASGAAVQCMNISMGIDEGTGL